ncbi:MAG: hypothetical protein E7356_02765 [Clostridiales bacterium]|nr:hypothetical protein [Clostridiales bacterium]
MNKDDKSFEYSNENIEEYLGEKSKVTSVGSVGDQLVADGKKSIGEQKNIHYLEVLLDQFPNTPIVLEFKELIENWNPSSEKYFDDALAMSRLIRSMVSGSLDDSKAYDKVLLNNVADYYKSKQIPEVLRTLLCSCLDDEIQRIETEKAVYLSSQNSNSDNYSM